MKRWRYMWFACGVAGLLTGLAIGNALIDEWGWAGVNAFVAALWWERVYTERGRLLASRERAP